MAIESPGTSCLSAICRANSLSLGTAAATFSGVAVCASAGSGTSSAAMPARNVRRTIERPRSTRKVMGWNYPKAHFRERPRWGLALLMRPAMAAPGVASVCSRYADANVCVSNRCGTMARGSMKPPLLTRDQSRHETPTLSMPRKTRGVPCSATLNGSGNIPRLCSRPASGRHEGSLSRRKRK